MQKVSDLQMFISDKRGISAMRFVIASGEESGKRSRRLQATNNGVALATSGVWLILRVARGIYGSRINGYVTFLRLRVRTWLCRQAGEIDRLVP